MDKGFNGVTEASRFVIFILLFLPPFLFYCSLSFPFICHREKATRHWRWQLWIGSALKNFFPLLVLIWSVVSITKCNEGFMKLTHKVTKEQDPTKKRDRHVCGFASITLGFAWITSGFAGDWRLASEWPVQFSQISNKPQYPNVHIRRQYGLGYAQDSWVCAGLLWAELVGLQIRPTRKTYDIWESRSSIQYCLPLSQPAVCNQRLGMLRGTGNGLETPRRFDHLHINIIITWKYLSPHLG